MPICHPSTYLTWRISCVCSKWINRSACAKQANIVTSALYYSKIWFYNLLSIKFNICLYIVLSCSQKYRSTHLTDKSNNSLFLVQGHKVSWGFDKSTGKYTRQQHTNASLWVAISVKIKSQDRQAPSRSMCVQTCMQILLQYLSRLKLLTLASIRQEGNPDTRTDPKIPFIYHLE